MPGRNAQLPVAVVLLVVLAGCGSAPVRDGGPARGTGGIASLPDDAVPRPEPRSRYGNSPVYEVFGKRYRVMPTSTGYRERGVASWYGRKFHGNLTAMREPYDMYAMTAAHKSLPLPTYVRVRNLKNDRSVIVRVNDRGPFVHNRIIDLSYAAALKLDMVRDGTSLVEVEAITFDEPPGDRPTARATAMPPAAAPAPAAGTEHQVFVQVGAFSSRDNAERRLALLRAGGIGTGFVHEESAPAATLYRVRIGPITGVEHYDLLVEELAALGIEDPYLVAE
ncbi:MAG: septal ring lytic transglycosylase RlpA family protein [Woeseiaceae bacterium]|nr:septal ring lytic transglycosylase RlpA family protein [Woeseiaceae bacterium]